MFKSDVISAALLFLVFFIEFFLTLYQKPDKKLVNDMMANLSLGICIILVGIFEKGLAFSFFSFVYSFSIVTPQVSWWLWLTGFLSCDFIHYAYHWLGHKTMLFWAAHVTHHSSVHFNISTALRTNFIHLFYRFIFWSPLCLFGIPPEMILFLNHSLPFKTSWFTPKKLENWVYSIGSLIHPPIIGCTMEVTPNILTKTWGEY